MFIVFVVFSVEEVTVVVELNFVEEVVEFDITVVPLVIFVEPILPDVVDEFVRIVTKVVPFIFVVDVS